MRVSTFERQEKYKLIALLCVFAFLLLLTRRFPLVLFAVFPAVGAGALIMRGRLQRKFARTPIRQLAYVSLMEPVYRYYNARVGEDESGHAITETRREVVGHRRRDVPLKRRIDPCYVNFDEYIEGKSNRLVIICGRSGTGKSELMKVLLLSVVRAPKVVFSFKPNDTHLRLPYHVIDVSKQIPDPFQNADDFSIAYGLTFPANLKGIMLSHVRPTVKNLARESKDWNQFKENLKRMQRKATDIQSEALSLIEQQTESLDTGGKGPSSSFSVNLAKDVVLDFSRLEENAKTFYAEIALRQVWNSITGRRPSLQAAPVTWPTDKGGIDDKKEDGSQRVALVIDEVHRLTRLYETMDARSILETIMPEVRQFGTLYTVTQNLTDIPDNLRQFGTELVFHTTSERDMGAMSRIDSAYPWIVKELRPYEFIDLTFRAGNEGLVPIFKTDLVAAHSAAESRAKDNKTMDSNDQAQQHIAPDYATIIAEKIDNGEVIWVSRLATLLEERDHVEKNIAKLKLRNVLLKLLAAGEIQVQKYDDAESGETVSLYFAKSEEEKVSPLHKYMARKLLDKLSEKQETVLTIAESGQSSPDIETETAYYEIETGLKTRTSDLKGRISTLSTAKLFIILVPNSEVAKSERYTSLNSSGVIVATLADFLRAKGRTPR